MSQCLHPSHTHVGEYLRCVEYSMDILAGGMSDEFGQRRDGTTEAGLPQGFPREYVPDQIRYAGMGLGAGLCGGKLSKLVMQRIAGEGSVLPEIAESITGVLTGLFAHSLLVDRPYWRSWLSARTVVSADGQEAKRTEERATV